MKVTLTIIKTINMSAADFEELKTAVADGDWQYINESYDMPFDATILVHKHGEDPLSRLKDADRC